MIFTCFKKYPIACFIFSNRNTMMTTIIKKMIATIPSMSRPSKDSPTAHAEPIPLVPLVTPSTEVLSSIFHGILKKGTIDRKAVFYVDQLLNCGGVYWFCRGVIFELVNLHRKDELTIGGIVSQKTTVLMRV